VVEELFFLWKKYCKPPLEVTNIPFMITPSTEDLKTVKGIIELCIFAYKVITYLLKSRWLNKCFYYLKTL